MENEVYNSRRIRKKKKKREVKPIPIDLVKYTGKTRRLLNELTPLN